MPIARYLVVVGGALAVLLLVAGWSLAVPPTSFPDQPEIIERTVIRIKSERKWPEKVVLDTSKPTMTPSVVMDPPTAQSSVPLPSDEAPDQSKLEAIGQLKPLTAAHHRSSNLPNQARYGTDGPIKACRERPYHTSADKSKNGRALLSVR